MAEAVSHLTLLLEGRDIGASAALRNVSRELTSLGRSASSAWQMPAPVRAIGAMTNALTQIGLANFGLQVLEQAFTGLTEAAIKAETVSTQTAATLKSTGGVSGQTAESIHDLADALSRVTPYEDETVQSAENLLLTFTNIGADIFPQATEAVLNMSTALGQDTKNSAIQLGKALQDPILGATALRRVGVALTESQRDQIKAFVQSGDIMSAQKVILRELQTEFGGSARAAGDTFAGKMAILNTQLDNIKEQAFTPLLGVAGAFATVLTSVALIVQSGLSAIGNGVMAVVAVLTPFRGALAALSAVMLAPVTLFVVMGAAAQALAEIIGPVLGSAVVGLGQAWEYVFGTIGPIAGAAFAWVQEKLAGFLDNIQRFLAIFGVAFEWRSIWQNVQETTGAGLNAVGGVADEKLAALGELFHTHGIGIGEKLAKGVEDGAGIAQALDAAIKDSQRVGEVIQQQMTTLQRENLDLKKQEAVTQLAMLPLKEQEADLNLQLTETSGKRAELELQSVAAREKLLGLTASQASEDLSYEQKRLQLKIQADALAGRGVSAADVNELVQLAKSKPAVELAALEAGRPVTLAERELNRRQLTTSVAQLPIQMRQADLAVQIAEKQREIERLNAQKQAGQLGNVPQLANLEAQKRALEDQQFIAKSLAADLDKSNKSGPIQLHIENHINGVTGEIDYAKLIDSTYAAVVDGLTTVQKTVPAAANISLPGARAPGAPF